MRRCEQDNRQIPEEHYMNGTAIMIPAQGYGKVRTGYFSWLEAEMDGDWRLPQRGKPFCVNRRRARSSHSKTGSIASTFSSLAGPVVVEAVRTAKALSTKSEAEGFHQLRVAFRKLRALYWAYAPYLGEGVTAQATEEFRRLATVAGGTRDWDIAGDLLKTAREDGASIDLLMSAANEKRAQAAAFSQAMIKANEVEALLNEALLRAQAKLQLDSKDQSVHAFARKRIRLARRTLHKRSRRVARSNIVDEEALHDVRKAGKKLRYLLEFFQPVIKRQRGRTIRKLTSVQNELGRFNDIAASEALIRSTSFDDVPPEVVQESLRWLEKQKCRRMRSASRRVRAIVR